MLTFFQTDAKKDVSLPLLLTFLGQDYPQEPIEHPFGFPHYMCFLTQEGNGELVVGGQRMMVRAGECFILHPEVPHCYHGLGKRWIVSSIGLTGNACAHLFDCLGIRESGIYTIADPSIFSMHIDALRILTEQSPDQTDWSVACYRFLLDLSSAILLPPAHDILKNDIQRESYSFQVIQYLESHLTEPVSIPSLAETIGLNSEYLCTVFKKETGLTIVQYAQRLKIGRARMLLERYPEKDAAEIGRECGYESPSYFGMQFKRITGTTPNRYRKSATTIRVQ